MIDVGSRVLHYRVTGALGSGGMGVVYRAEDVRLGREVALKFLHAEAAADAEQRARLLREARAASTLRSSHIASIHDIGELEDGRVFLVMELVPGEPLSARLAAGPLQVREAVEIAAQIADALDEAHSRGVVHRDVKSANVMVDDRGRVKVLDFGLAKVARRPDVAHDVTQQASLETRAGTVLGTFSYMSPEQALGRVVDHRSDIFSLGVVLFEMLTAQRPFDGATATETLSRVVHEPPPALLRLNYAVPPALDHVVGKALAKDPAFRYQSAREMYIDLMAIARQIESGTRSSGDSVVRSPYAITPEGMPLARRERSVAVLTFTNLRGEPTDEWIGSGIAETVTADLQSLKGIVVIGRAQVSDAVRSMAALPTASAGETFALEIGRRIGATWIVNGAFQRLGQMVRITAEFLDVASGTILRTVKVDGSLDAIFDLQDRIVFELSQGLNLALDDSAIHEIEKVETRSVEAYEAYSRGMINLRMATRDSLDRAIAQFERAVTSDPEYAEAWMALGAALDLKGEFLSLPELADRALDALRKAIAIAPDRALAHSRLASAYLTRQRYEEAQRAAAEAVRLDPNLPTGHGILGRILWFGLGRFEEGIRELEIAASLNTEGGYAFLQLSLLYALTGDFRKAEATARRAIDLQERYLSGREGLQIIGAHVRLGYALYRQGRYDEAIREYERELSFVSSSDHALRDRASIETHQKLSAAYWRKGDRDAADREFQRARLRFSERLASGADDGATKYYMAALHALRGDADTAARYLGEALQQLPGLNRARALVDPDFDPVRDHPLVASLLAERPATA